MGRGRKKAKATKIARELKYADLGTDLARLQTELNTNQSAGDTHRLTATHETDSDIDDV
ncbi:DUF3073 family protein [Catenulispora rubra]|uniref:DUF3073 family protein n=1 Tax=Catenulispora rubra TaxID=280293 RepID=UPI0018927053|nr:DUF3073 family protein [Catenulispora rubra]